MQWDVVVSFEPPQRQRQNSSAAMCGITRRVGARANRARDVIPLARHTLFERLALGLDVKETRYRPTPSRIASRLTIADGMNGVLNR